MASYPRTSHCPVLRIALEKDGADRAALLQESLAILEQTTPHALGYFPSQVRLALVRFELRKTEDVRALLSLLSQGGALPLGLPARARIGVFADLAECVCEMNDPRAVRVLSERLRPDLGLHVSLGVGASYGGPVSYVLGRLALASSSMDEARVLFEQAIREAECVGARLHRAWAEFRLAQTLKGNEGNQDADRRRALLDSSWIAAERYGLARLKRMIEEY